MGTTQKALVRGVPVCVVPQGRDQFEVARRVEVAGCGTRLLARNLTAARLRDKVRQTMAMTDSARRVAAGTPPPAERRTGPTRSNSGCSVSRSRRPGPRSSPADWLTVLVALPMGHQPGRPNLQKTAKPLINRCVASAVSLHATGSRSTLTPKNVLPRHGSSERHSDRRPCTGGECCLRYLHPDQQAVTDAAALLSRHLSGSQMGPKLRAP
jgi:hypothetical protein